MKNPAWLTASNCVIRSVINKDRNTDVYMPQLSSLVSFNIQRLFD